MEAKEVHAASISNYEVMAHLQKLKEHKKNKKNQGQLATIIYESLQYLEKSPCINQSVDAIKSCIAALKPYNLTKNELYMILNNPPTTPLEVQLIVEESEERLVEEQVDEMLTVIRTHLNLPNVTEDGN